MRALCVVFDDCSVSVVAAATRRANCPWLVPGA